MTKFCAFSILCGLVILSCFIDVSKQTSPVCNLPPEVGPCEALIPSFYYKPSENKCLPFNYGGCKGNGNRFATKVQCENMCKNLE